MVHGRTLVMNARKTFINQRGKGGKPRAYGAVGAEGMVIEQGFWDENNMVEMDCIQFNDKGFVDVNDEAWTNEEWETHVDYGNNEVEDDFEDLLSGDPDD